MPDQCDRRAGSDGVWGEVDARDGEVSRGVVPAGSVGSPGRDRTRRQGGGGPCSWKSR
jgi:hypothetical protein